MPRVIKVCVGFVSCFKKTQSTKVIEARIQEEHMAAHEYTNDGNLEVAWAIKAYEEAEMHYNVITSVDPTYLSLCPEENVIYEEFRRCFPEFDVSHFTEDDLKSSEAKKEWRTFCNKFEKEVNNFNYGALLRLDPLAEYSENNTIFATRIQYLAIEIARNREGITKRLYDKATMERRTAKVRNKETVKDEGNVTHAFAEISVNS